MQIGRDVAALGRARAALGAIFLLRTTPLLAAFAWSLPAWDM